MQNTLFRLFSFLESYRERLWLACTASVANKILDLMPPLLVGWVVASLSGHPPQWLHYLTHSTDPWHLATGLASLTIIIFGFESITEWVSDSSFMRLAQDIQHHLRIATYKQIQSREIAFFETHRTGETLALMNDDVNQLERFFNSGLSDLIQLATLMIFASIVLFSTSWQLAFIGMIPIPIIIWGSLKFQRKMAPRYRKVRESVGTLASRLENNLGGITVIKSFTAEDFETQRVVEASNHYRTNNYDAIKLSAVFVPIIRMAVAVGFAAVLLVGSYWILNQNHQVTIAELVMFSMLIQRVLWPLTSLGTTLDNYQRAKSSADRIINLLNTEATIKDAAEPITITTVKGRIQFEQVQFYYHPHNPILTDLTFDISPGETVGIAGQTGAGKSTLVKLLLRLYEVNAGNIKIDGYDIRHMRLHDLRRHIALVSQDVYLFHGTVTENIAYGLQTFSQKDIVHAAQIAHLHDFIITLPNGYDSIIGERGIKLSGGQRQRLSIARAILKNAPILVLDEATSAVDTETEKIIQENLKTIIAGKTALIIAHRLSTIRDADRILVIGSGGIVEQGNHDELIKANGIYADLWHVQTASKV